MRFTKRRQIAANRSSALAQQSCSLYLCKLYICMHCRPMLSVRFANPLAKPPCKSRRLQIYDLLTKAERLQTGPYKTVAFVWLGLHAQLRLAERSSCKSSGANLRLTKPLVLYANLRVQTFGLHARSAPSCLLATRRFWTETARQAYTTHTRMAQPGLLSKTFGSVQNSA